MKSVLLLLCLSSGTFSFAQNTIFAGKITDGKGRALKDAIIYVAGANAKADTKSDEHGLYHTQMLPEGDYAVTAAINGKKKGSGTVHLAYVRGEKRYYLLQLGEQGLSITTTDKDLFMETKLESVRKDSHRVDGPTKSLVDPEGNSQHYFVPKKKPQEKK